MYNSFKLNKDIHEKDNLLDGFTFEDLITSVQSNCPDITKESIEEEALTLLDARIDNMRTLLHTNMEILLERCFDGREMER